MSHDIQSNVISPTKDDNNLTDDKEKHKTRLLWTEQSEELLACWADIASCYKWLNEESYRKYSRINTLFAIPIIILSTVTGTLNIGLETYVPTEYKTYATAGIGAINIFTGILTTLSSYYRFAQLSESYLNSSIGWSKLQRNIAIELRIEKEFRKDADSFIKMCRMDYDRLLEQNPIILKEAIDKFKKAYKNITDLIVPDICDSLSHTTIHRVKKESILPEIKDILLNDSNTNNSKQNLSEIFIEKEEYNPIRNVKNPTEPYVPAKLPDGKVQWVRRHSAYERNNNPHETPIIRNRSTTEINTGVSVKDIIKRFDKEKAISRIIPFENPSTPISNKVKLSNIVIDTSNMNEENKKDETSLQIVKEETHELIKSSVQEKTNESNNDQSNDQRNESNNEKVDITTCNDNNVSHNEETTDEKSNITNTLSVIGTISSFRKPIPPYLLKMKNK